MWAPFRHLAPLLFYHLRRYMTGNCLHFIGRATGFEQLDRGILPGIIHGIDKAILLFAKSRHTII